MILSVYSLEMNYSTQVKFTPYTRDLGMRNLGRFT